MTRTSRKLKSAAAGVVVLGLIAVFLAAGGYNILPRLQKGVNHGVSLEGVAVEGMLRKEVEAFVRELAWEIDRLPRNAYLDMRTGELVAEVLGWRVDLETTVRKIMDAPAHKMVLLELIQLDPEVTMAHYHRINKEIGAYQTWIGGGGGRATNIILATASLNNYMMLPGDIFSFNQANGPRTAERGYQPAPVIGGIGLGGGVCQVSTTLYNAVLRAGLEVVERYPHSQPVGYVPPGMDATISDYLDFKFRNNTDQIIMIKSSNWSGSIDIRILQD